MLGSLILVHELGHFLTAKLVNVEVEKIIIYPLGGISKFKIPLNISIGKEFLILIMGPIFQCLAYFLLYTKCPLDRNIIAKYHYGILIFNLLPIYPLDGGKLLNLFLSAYIPYRKSLILSIIISYSILLFLWIINYPQIHINLIIMSLFLLYKITKEYQQINLLYGKLLLERYLYHYRFKKSIIINKNTNFHRNKRHLLKIGEKYYLESEYLEKLYKKLKND